MSNRLFKILDSNLFYKRFAGLRWYGKLLEIYSCNYKDNNSCKKTHCKYLNSNAECANTTEWKYAKRTPLNYIKRIINIIRGK